MFRRTCEASNYGYIEEFDFCNNKWDRRGDALAYEVTADQNGHPWIVSKGGLEPVMKWDPIEGRWNSMELDDAYNLNAGPSGHVYATAPPNISGG